MVRKYDAVVVGSGPNGLAAAIRIAQAGRSVAVLEEKDSLGGGARSAELTLPGFVHDTCSAVHPLAVASPYLRTLPLEQHGLVWTHPDVPFAHPFEDGPAALCHRSLDETARGLGEDGPAYARMMRPWLRHWESFLDDALQPLHLPHRPFLLADFGLKAMRSADGLARARFKGRLARGLFAGVAAHSFLPLTQPPSAAIGLMLMLAAHAAGWPFPRGGAGRLTQAMASYLRSLGGEIHCGRKVAAVADLPPTRAVLFDLTPRQLLRIAPERFTGFYRRQLERFKYGPAVFKLDWALSAAIPWRDPAVARAGTVHIGGPLEEVAESELEPWRGNVSPKPFILLAQTSLFDDSRAPAGQHTAWAYFHVPAGMNRDLTELMESRIETFAPGFRDRILARRVTGAKELEAQNSNLVEGDISGGIADFRQLFFRPAIRLDPYATPVKDWYICSASTPPGSGVHGMCGYHAAGSVLRRSW